MQRRVFTRMVSAVFGAATAFERPASAAMLPAVVPESLSGAKRKALPWVLKALPKLPAPLARRLKQKLAP